VSDATFICACTDYVFFGYGLRLERGKSYPTHSVKRCGAKSWKEYRENIFCKTINVGML